MVATPFASRLRRTLSRVTTIFLKEPPVPLSERTSCALFSSSPKENARDYLGQPVVLMVDELVVGGEHVGDAVLFFQRRKRNPHFR